MKIRITSVLLILLCFAVGAKADDCVHEYDANGICTKCSGYETPTLVDGEYQITKVGHLLALNDYCSTHSNFTMRLMNDLDLSCVCSADKGNWTPIGNASVYPQGCTFYGDGHTISNLYIDDADATTEYWGLFGHIYDTKVENLTLTNVYVNVPNASSVGSFAGYTSGGGTISKIDVLSGSVSANSYVGGVIGQAASNISQCSNSTTITGRDYVGGITGQSSKGYNVSQCENHGAITVSNNDYGYTGGIIGRMYGTVTMCINTADISSDGRVGGIVGGQAGASANITDCLNTGNITGTFWGYPAGGIVGESRADCNIQYCLNMGSVTSACASCGLISGYANGQFLHCAYLSTATLTQNGNVLTPVGAPGLTSSDLCSVTAAQLSSGQTAVYLQNKREELAWGELLNTDATPYPAIHADVHPRVYAIGTFDCRLLPVGDATYSNTAGGEATYLDHAYDANAICTVCGSCQAPELIDEVYHITLPGHLAWFSTQVKAGKNTIKACLDADIDLSCICSEEKGNWAPIGTGSSSSDATIFQGTFDGQNHAVTGLYINSSDYNQGLFGRVYNATIKNLSVTGTVGSATSSTPNYVGIIVGNASYSTLTNLESHGEVLRARYVGGVVGYYENSGNILNCRNYATINAVESYVGGVAGNIYASSYTATIDGLVNYGAVSGWTGVGGVCGYIQGQNVTLQNVINHGAVTVGSEQGGGVCGYAANVTCRNIFNDGDVTNTMSDKAYPIFGSYSNSAEHVQGLCLYDDAITLTGATSGELEKLDDYSTSDNYGTKRTHAQVLSGAVAYELGAAFGQRIPDGVRPELGAPRVYYGCYQHARAEKLYDEPIYSNLILTDAYEAHTFNNGFCTICGKNDGYIYQSNVTTLADWTSENQGQDGTTSTHTYDITATASTLLSFDWTCSSEARYDKFSAVLYQADGETVVETFVDAVSGVQSGSVSYTIAEAGTYVLKVWYKKDSSSASGTDTATLTNGKYGTSVKTDQLYGDLNADTHFDAKDATTLSDMINGKTTPNLTVGDLNGDGKLTITDLVQLIHQLLLP